MEHPKKFIIQIFKEETPSIFFSDGDFEGYFLSFLNIRLLLLKKILTAHNLVTFTH